MEAKRNPFRINVLQNQVENPFDLLGKSLPTGTTVNNKPKLKTPKTPKTKLFDLLRSTDISRTFEYALESNKRAQKKQKQQLKVDTDPALTDDEEYLSLSDDENKENVILLLIYRLLLMSKKHE